MAKKIGRKPTEKTFPTPVSSARRDNSGPSAPAEHSAAEKTFPIVGVGASAGGLEAFTQLLESLPASTGMAFVLIQHLDPTHESQLTEILSRKSKLPVREVHGDTPLAADNVYVIPASENLRIEKGILHTVPRPDASGVRNMPIDDFLQ